MYASTHREIIERGDNGDVTCGKGEKGAHTKGRYITSCYRAGGARTIDGISCNSTWVNPRLPSANFSRILNVRKKFNLYELYRKGG